MKLVSDRRIRFLLVALVALVALIAVELPEAALERGAEAQSNVVLISNLRKAVGNQDAPIEHEFVVGAHSRVVEGGIPTLRVYTQAQSFRTGGNAGGYLLARVTVLTNAGGISSFNKPGVTLRSDSSGSPGDTVKTLSNPSPLPSTSVGDFPETTFTAPNETMLSANTTYWIVFEETTILRPKYHLEHTAATGEDSGGQTGWSIGNNKATKADDGAFDTGIDNPIKMKLEGTLVSATEAGVTVSDTTLTVTEESSSTATYTVVLDAPPTEDVTVTPSVPQGSPVSITPSSVTFTTENWDDAQTFTVSGTADDDLTPDTVTISHRVSGYGNVTTAASVAVTVNDNDTASVSVSTDTLTVSEEGAGTYTIVLDHQPSGNVTVTINPPTNTDVTTDPTSLTFATGNWNMPQTVTVRAANDGDSTNDTATITHTVSGSNFDGVSAANVSVSVTDDDTPGVAVDPTALTIDEGGNGVYTVKLNTQPSTSVTVTASLPLDSGLTLSTTSLMFTTTNWADTQSITVTAQHDDDLEDDSVTISHTVQGYTGVGSVDPVVVTITDDDTAGVTVSPTMITVPEGSTESAKIVGAIYSVILDHEPANSVTVTITGPSGSDLTINKSSLTFTTEDWDAAQEVTVTAAEDDDSVNDTGTITHTVTSGDTKYEGADADSVSVTVDDNDTDGVSITPTTLTLTEAAGIDHSKTYTVKLDTVPSGNVTVTVNVGSGSGVEVSGATLSNNRLTFTTGNWSTPQTVTVTASADDDAFNNSGSITHSVSGYGAATAPPVAVSVTDDDEQGVVISDTDLDMTEGSTTTYSIKLSSQPVNATTGADDTATVAITPPKTGLSVDPSSITFDKDTWDVFETVTITAAEDEDGVENSFSITHGVSGADYGNVNAPTLHVDVQDNDQANIDVSVSSLSIDEGGSATFTVQLTTLPAEQDVTLSFTQPSNTDVTVSPEDLTFTTTNGKMPQTVTVMAEQDAEADDETASIRYSTSQPSAAGEYDNKSGTIPVTVVDDEEPEVVISVTDISVGEESSGTYTIQLRHPPTNVLEVLVSVSPENSDVTFSPDKPTFNEDSWNVPQTVTLSAAHDDDGDNDTVTVNHTIGESDADEYPSSLSIPSVNVTVNDNDPTGVTISKSSLLIAEGGSESYTVVLDTKPGGDVVITPSATDSDLSFNPTSLTFMPDAWDTPQTVTVRAFTDDDAQDDTPTIEHTVTGYGDVSADDIMVTVDDDDARGINVGFSDADGNRGVVHEEGGTGTLMRVSLMSSPINADGSAGTVTITPSFPSGLGLSVTPSSRQFTSTNWSTVFEFTLTAASDVNAVDENTTITLTPSGADYDSVAPATRGLIVADDDEPQLVPSRTSVTDVDEGSATGGSYTIKPSYQPSGALTVNLTSDNDDLTLTPTDLSFDGSNWRTAQTVTVTAGQDDDAFDDTATISHTVSMTAGQMEYDGITVATVSVTVDDDDTPRVLANPATLTINEPASGTETATYTVTLETLPVDSNGAPANVTVTIVDPTNTDIVANPATVTLGETTWDTGATVTVSVSADADTQADTGTVTHTAAGADYDSAGADSVTVSVVDTDSPNVLIDPSNVTVTEGASDGSYTVKLSTQPDTDVTVTPRSTNSEVTFSPATLTFTSSTWGTAQTVTVTAAEDADAAVDTATISHSSSGADYVGLTITSVNVTVEENDTLNIDVAPLTLPITEVDGGTGTGEYTVTVHAAPSGGNLTIQITRSGDTNVSTNPSSLSFSASEWTTPTQANVAKTVTVNVSDDADAVDSSATLSHTVGGSSDYATESITASPVAVEVTDSDSQAVRILNDAENQEIDAITVAESSTARYKIVLTTQPTGNVTITIGVPTDSVVSVKPTELVFTADTWNNAQAVIVSGGADEDANEDTGVITHTVAGADYGDANVTADSLTVTVTDISVRGVEISTTDDPYEFGEGESINYRVRLETQPSGTVTITPASTNDDISFDPARVTFNENDWNTFKTIEVSAGQDDDAAPDTATVTHTVIGADYGANNVEVDDIVNLDIADDDQAEVNVSVSELEITEGTGGAYTIVLGSRPVGGSVTVTLTPPTNPDITIDKTELTFTSTDWNQAQTITVTAAHDTDTQVDRGTIRHTVSGANFDGAMIPNIPVTVIEDDMASVNVEPTDLMIGEGKSATYTVVLGTQPSGNVTIQASSDNSDVGTSPSTLTFISSNWDEAQTVTVSASSDSDATNDVATISHTARGNEYEGETITSVSVTVVEDGTAISDTSSFLRSASCDTNLSLTWNAPTPDDAAETASYRIQWKKSEVDEYDATNQVTAAADATSHTLDELDNGVSYDVRVTALDEMGEPLWQREITATPSDQACIAQVSFGNILADSTPVIVELEEQAADEQQVNMRYRSLNPGAWSEVRSQIVEPGETRVTFEIRGLKPSSNYEVQAWLGSQTPPTGADRSDSTDASQPSVAQTVFTTGHAPAGATFSGGSRSGRILRIEPSITAVTLGPGDEVLLSVEVYGRQEIHDNGLADKAPEDDRPVFTWSSEGGGVFSEANIRAEWRNDYADDRIVRFTAPRRSETIVVEARLDGALDCLAAREGETAAEQESRCSARIEVTVNSRPQRATSTSSTAPVNPQGVIPETLTDSEGVAYAVFTPVDGGSFAGDGYSLHAGPGAVADGELIGISIAPVGDASNVGKYWHRYTLGGSIFSIGMIDSAGEKILDYLLGETATACVPLPADMRGNIADLVLAATDGDGDLTVLSTRVKITPEGAVVCGNVSSLPVSVAVATAGSPPKLPDTETEPEIEEELPETGGAELGVQLLLLLLLGGSALAISGMFLVRVLRGRAQTCIDDAKQSNYVMMRTSPYGCRLVSRRTLQRTSKPAQTRHSLTRLREMNILSNPPESNLMETSLESSEHGIQRVSSFPAEL